jgi:riboflavin biosynthesis pyrimidine reductase
MAISDYMDWARARVDKALAQGPGDRIVAVLIGSTDLFAAVDGRTAGLTSEADRALIRAWREAADALLVGPRTLEAELYSGSIVGAEGRSRRVSRGRSPLPPILTIDRSHQLDLDLALRGENPPPMIVYVTADGEVRDTRVTWVQLTSIGIGDVLRDARERFDARLVVAEGGPRLLRSALEEGVVSDLSLTIAPHLVGRGLRLFGTDGAPDHVELLPADVVDGYVFAHWSISPAARAHVNANS